MMRWTMLEVGSIAPEFSVPDDHGVVRSLAEARGRWLVLWWYPEAGSSGCSLQAASLGSTYPEFEAEDANVWGISFNTVDKNDAFSCDFDLAFPLLSDADKAVGTAYEVLREPDAPFADKPLRITYIIDPEGTITFAELVPNDSLPEYGARALSQLKEAKAARAAAG